jgi:hypothetical protein
MDTIALVKKIAEIKEQVPGGDIGRVLELAPDLLLANQTEFAAAIRGVEAEMRKETTPKNLYKEVSRIVRDGGAASLLARGKVISEPTGVLAVTEKANVHFAV